MQEKARMLPEKDRSLIKMYLDRGASFRQIGRVAGLNEVTVARRIRSVTRRLAEGSSLECLRYRHKLDVEELDIATDYYLRGMSMRNIAAGRGLSYHRVRKTVQKVEHLRRESQSHQREHQSNMSCED